MPQTTDWADVQVVGIPRALLFYRFGVLWTTFFESIGRTVVVSDPTDKAIADEGDRLSVDECCLASKVFVGHVESLVGRCDAVFVPCYPTSDHRSGFCTKFQSATDMVRNTFRDDKLRVVSCEVRNARKTAEVRRSFCDMAARMGVAPKDARAAFKVAWDAQRTHDEALSSAQERVLRRLGEERRAADAAAASGDGSAARPLGILVVAHPYISHDPYLSGAVIDSLEEMGAHGRLRRRHGSRARVQEELRVLRHHAVAHQPRAHRFHPSGPGSASTGIVLISAFPCGPDSMTDDAIMRCIQGTPILNLMIDAQSGTAGVETRVESFVDILRFQQKGGYVHE